MSILRILKKLDRIAFSVPLNYPVFYQLKNSPNNILLRIFKSILANLTMSGYEIYTNERIVEIPFIFRHLRLPLESKILDFGCNESLVSIELASIGYDVIGVDLNNYPLSHPNFKFVKGDFFKNNFPDGFFDAIVAISAVEHCGISEAYGAEEEVLGGDKKVMEEFLRVLKHKGNLILTVPFGLKGIRKGHFGQRVYDEESLSSLLADFKLINEEYYIGIDRRYWVPCSKRDLTSVDSISKGFTQGVACIYAEKQ